MGCGKTVQVMSLLSALFAKTGTGLDVQKIHNRKKLIKARVQRQKQQEEQALLEGRVSEACQVKNLANIEELQLPQRWWPVLIVVPPTVLENWENEFARFTHFSVATYADKGRDVALSQIISGMAEVMLTKRSTYANPDDFHAINSIPLKWKLVIIDEFHIWKVSDIIEGLCLMKRPLTTSRFWPCSRRKVYWLQT
jgi:SNF2 family DNA or RNA helicase